MALKLMQRLLVYILLLLTITGGQPSLHADIGIFEKISSIWGGNKADAPEYQRVRSEVDEDEAQALLDRALMHDENGQTFRANRLFKKIIKKYSESDAAADALFYRGYYYMTKERWKKAFYTFQQLVREHPKFEQFDRVVGAQFECATALMEGARGKIFGVIPGFRQYEEANLQFEYLISNAPYSDYAPLALMNISIVANLRDKPEDAIDALDRIINFYPQSMLAPDAYYNLALTYSNLVNGEEYDQGATRQAISYYEDFLILYPSNEFIGDVEANLKQMENLLANSRLNLGDFFYFYRSNNTAALTFYNEAITTAPDSDSAMIARERIKDIEAGVKPATSGNLFGKLLGVE
jgi:outer membrane protein assembly factor BamD